MDVIALVLVLASAVFWIAVVAVMKRHDRLASLDRVEPGSPAGAAPLLSVIVPARDEERHVGTAVRSLLAQTWPALEVIAVDDRSRDATGDVLDRLAAGDARLTVLHVERLPEGWLGKTHACHLAASRARGEWLFFTDADVTFAPDALARALSFAREANVGHLVATPTMVAHGFFERGFVSAFAVFMNLRYRVWDLSRAGSAAYFGLGAFNLVRRDAYERSGGYRTLALEVLDDVKLGMIVRRSGARQAVVNAGGRVAVRWQPGVRATLRGLVKNGFAAAEWRWRTILWRVAGLWLVSLAPVAGVLFGPTRGIRLVALVPLLLSVGLHAATARRVTRGSGLEGLCLPAAAFTLGAVMVWSAAAASLRRGVVWRGTPYPLAQLRAGCVRERDWPASAAPSA